MQKILIADTSPETTEALSASLSGNYEVHTCADPADLIRLLDLLRPDAVIVSAPLAGLDGLLQIGRLSSPPRVLVILTNIVTEQLLQTALSIHASYILRIPFALQPLLRKLHDLLGNKKSPQY